MSDIVIGHAGGLIGYDANGNPAGFSGYGATQISGGSTGVNRSIGYHSSVEESPNADGKFGYGGTNYASVSSGGGGGYYGGGSGLHPGSHHSGGGRRIIFHFRS